MRKLPRISDAEWEVMRVVWERAPVTAGDVIRELTPHAGWNHRTIRTMLARLVAKGAIGVKDGGGPNLYSPRVRRDECVRAETRSFVDRVLSGRSAPLLLQFVEEADLTRSEVDELKRRLEKKLEGAEEA